MDLFCYVRLPSNNSLHFIKLINSTQAICIYETHTLIHSSIMLYITKRKRHTARTREMHNSIVHKLSLTHTRTIVLFSFLSHQTMRCVLFGSPTSIMIHICIIEKCWMKEPPRKWNTKNTTNSKDKYKLFRVYGAQTISKSKPMMTMWILYIRAPTLFWIS